MPDVALELNDATELAELLSFVADWLAGSEAATLADSLARFLACAGYDLDTLRTDLHRFVFLLGASDGEDLFGQHQ